MPLLERPGARIYFAEAGAGDRAIVFSHGLLMDHEMFAPQAEALGGEFRCVLWDQRGHGQTTQEGEWTYWDSAADLVALLDHLDVEKAVLAGMSQGGFVSLRVALRAPERLKGLFVIDTQAGTDPEPVEMMNAAIAAQWKEHGPDESVLAAVHGTIVAPAEPGGWPDKWRAMSPQGVAGAFRALIERDALEDRLGEIEVPALVVHGDADAAIPTERAEALCSGLPNCEDFVLIPGGGHASNLSHPDEVNRALLAFARKHA